MATITSELDLITGTRTYMVPGSPVPVITPMGPAPGVLRISADTSGKVTDVRAVLRPKASDVAQIADLLSRLATFNLPAGALRGIDGQPVVTFALKPDAIGEIRTAVHNANDLQAFMGETVLQQGHRYVVDDMAVTS